MIALLAVAALIAVLTVWFLARPLRRAATAPKEDRQALMALRDRLLAQLREIDVETGDRNIDANVAADERQRLEAELAKTLKGLDAADVGGANVAATSSKHLWLPTVIVLAIALPLASAGLYFAKNRTMLAQLAQAQAPAGEGIPPMVLEMVARLEKRLAEQPSDPQGWARLGRAYAVLGRTADAQQAYARAQQLAPGDVEILNAYAVFLISLDPSRASPEAVAIFAKLLALKPQHPGALWALGLAAYQQQQFGQAVKYWERLERQLPPNSDVAAELKHALDSARAEQAGNRK